MAEIAFPVKEITWSAYEQKTPILLQDQNGPCPLIALVNTLLLAADIEFRTTGLLDNPQIALSESSSGVRELLQRHVGGEVLLLDLLTCLGDTLLEIPLVEPEVVKRLLDSLPLLHTGLTVNPNVTTGRFPPQDLAATIFGAFGLNFVHGWVHQPGELDEALEEVILRLQTFDALQDFMLTTGESESRGIAQWLDQNSSQLTHHGLTVMDTRMEPDTVAIFFRNNHFSTVYKGDNNDFYLLLTDTVFTKRPNFVWQSLISASGTDDLFFTGDFVPVDDGANLDPEDLTMLRQLQEEEDAAMAKKLQLSYESGRREDRETSATDRAAGRMTVSDREERVTAVSENNETKAGGPQEEKKKKKKKKKSNCVIV